MKSTATNTSNKMTYNQQRAQWPCIVEWCRIMGSYEYYLKRMLNEAEAANAPRNATYLGVQTPEGYKPDMWQTTDGIKNPALQYLVEQGKRLTEES